MRHVVFGLLLAWAATAVAGTPSQTCQVRKNKEAGKYAACRQNAEAKRAVAGDGPAYQQAIGKCATQYASKWPVIEAKAGGACPGSTDQTAIQGFIDTHAMALAWALGGGELPDYPGDLAACQAGLGMCAANLGISQAGLSTCGDDLTTCHTGYETCGDTLATCQTDLGTCGNELTTSQTNLGSCNDELATCEAGLQSLPLTTRQTECWDINGVSIPCTGTGQDGEAQRGLARSYVDNGDGTVADQRTGLMWEKLSDDDSIHDKDTIYTFTTALTKVATLNASGGFAGHTDWRLPNIVELQTIVDYGTWSPAIGPLFHTGCVAACTVTTCSCTEDSYLFWTSTSYWGVPNNAYGVSFADGQVWARDKTWDMHVRAVRGGS